MLEPFLDDLLYNTPGDAAALSAFADWLEDCGEYARAAVARRCLNGRAVLDNYDIDTWFSQTPEAVALMLLDHNAFRPDDISVSDRAPYRSGDYYTWSDFTLTRTDDDLKPDRSELPRVLLLYVATNATVIACRDDGASVASYRGSAVAAHRALSHAIHAWYCDRVKQYFGIPMAC